MILALETSCDDTCAAVVSAEGEIASNVIASQGLLHARYGGVVPEIASRHHLELVDAVTADALERAGVRLDDIETVAVTRGPGLIGALLVGLSSAKALAATRQLPLVPVDHLHGHVVASTLGPHPIEAPYLSLVASGGHTFLARVDHPSRYSILGQTLDDAAGEAFDKGVPTCVRYWASVSAIRGARRSTALPARAIRWPSTFRAARLGSSTSASAA